MNKHFSLELGAREYTELQQRGYLKLKIEVPRNELSELDNAFIRKQQYDFRYRTEVIKTVLTSVDVAREAEGDICKVFLGFAPL